MVIITRNKQKKQNNEGFGKGVGSVTGVIWTFVSFYAIYLSFKFKQKFDIGDILLACCCSPVYVAYRLAIPSTCVNPK